jgi:hypothetical protein
MEVTLYAPVHLQTGLVNAFTFLLFACTAEHSANEALLLHATWFRGDTAPVGRVARCYILYRIVFDMGEWEEGVGC